jgi:hypothetical protein
MTKYEAAEMINDLSNFADDLENCADINTARKMAIDALRAASIEDQTKKYADMIESFECDFSLAAEPNRKYGLDCLQVKIERGNKRMLADIKLLQELSYGVRNGILRIVKQSEE